MDRSALLIIAVLATVLAGCADDPAPAEDPLFADQPEAAPGLGVIRGVVVDAAITPIAGADVTLVGAELATVTDDNGAFSFVDVDPGAHFIQVGKTGWSTVQQSVQVEADEDQPPVLRVMLVAEPSTLPRADTLTLDGFIQCGWGTPLNLGTCPGLDDQDDSELIFPFSGSPAYVQTEIDWTSTQPAGTQLYLIVAVCDAPCEYDFDDRIVNEVRDSPAIDRATAGDRTSGEVGIIASAGGPANGTGIALDQSFTAYVTFFYNVEPDTDWTFLEDGEYVVA